MKRIKSMSSGKSNGRGVLGSLRQLLSRRPRLRMQRRRLEHRAAPLTLSPTVRTPLSPQRPLERSTNPSTDRATPVIPAPPRDPDAEEESDDSLALDEGEEERGDEVATEKKKTTKKKTKRTRSSSTWVAKLLNQTAAPKDRVHTRKKRKPRPEDDPSSRICHAILRVVSESHAVLLGRVFDFLQPLEPVRHCALVNHAIAVSVTKYYAQYCDWPRPRAYLAHRILSRRHAEQTGVLRHVLDMLPLADRVRASATSHAFRRVVDALPLHLMRREHATQFLTRQRPSRLDSRFSQTTVLHCDNVAATDAVRLLQFMSDDNGDHFRAVHDIVLQRLGRFETESVFVDLVQSLFSDRISRALQTLVLSDVNLVDANFRHLARLFYDGHFPRLETLDVSRNLFSSRFMRDWARSFYEDRFKTLRILNITGVGMGVEDMERFFECLRHVPKLRILHISHNVCSMDNIQTLASILNDCCLVELEALHCSAISVSDHGIHVLIEALSTPGAYAALQSLDLSGNDLGTGDQAMRSLADAFIHRRWLEFHSLNLSFTKPLCRGWLLLMHSLAMCVRTPLRMLHLVGNELEGDVFESLTMAMEAGALFQVEVLNLSDNKLSTMEFELLAHALCQNACPRLQTLLLSANNAQGEGITRFLQFFSSQVARTLHTLDLSGNAIPAHSLDRIAEELINCHCEQLQVLNVSRNAAPRSLVRFQKLIRSNKCPSLACVQVGYAQAEEQGYAFVRTTRSKMSVDELRRLKQLRFEARMKQMQQENITKAAQAAARCKRQTKLLRELYDHMENQADRALRRRKRVRKSPHLHIHEEIQRLKQEKYHEKVQRELEA